MQFRPTKFVILWTLSLSILIGGSKLTHSVGFWQLLQDDLPSPSLKQLATTSQSLNAKRLSATPSISSAAASKKSTSAVTPTLHMQSALGQDDEVVPSNLLLTLPYSVDHQILADAHDVQSGDSYTLSTAPANELQVRWAQAERLLQQGIQQYQAHQFQEALQSSQKALSIYQEATTYAEFPQASNKRQIDCLNNLGLAYYALESYQDAIKVYQKALVIQQKISSQEGEALSLNNIGVMYRRLGEETKAFSLYQQALAIYQKLYNSVGEKVTLHNIGEVSCQVEFSNEQGGCREQELKYYKRALILARKEDSRRIESIILVRLGFVSLSESEGLEESTEYSESLALNQQAIKLLRETDDGWMGIKNQLKDGILDSDLETKVLHYQGIEAILEDIYFRPSYANGRGYHLIALNTYLRALIISKSAGDRAAESDIWLQIGDTYYQMERYTEALEVYHQALKSYKELSDRKGEKAVLNYMGVANEAMGQYQEALKLHEQSLVIDKEIGDHAGEGYALGHMGKIYQDLGQYPKALELYKQALTVHQESDNRYMQIITRNSIAVLYNHFEQFEKTLEIYGELTPSIEKQALFDNEVSKFVESSDRNAIAAAFNNIGVAYRSLNQFSHALAAHNKAILHLTNDFPAREYDRRIEGDTYNDIGLVYKSLGKYPKALESHQEALKIFESIKDPAGKAFTLSNIGTIYENKGNPSRAIEYYRQSINVTESIQGAIKLEDLKSSFASDHFNVYSRLISLLGNKGDFASAFKYAEWAKARAFLDQIARGKIDFHSGVDARLLKQEQELSKQIMAVQTQLTKLENQPLDQRDKATIEETRNRLNKLQQQYADLLTKMQLQNPTVASMVTVKIASLEEIQRLLKPNTTLVEYFVTSEHILAFTVTRDQFHPVIIDLKREEILEALMAWQDASADPSFLAGSTKDYPEILKQLHKWLITPLQPYLKTSHLIFVPHDVLHYLPFAALTDGNTYLTDRYTLSLLPSANTLRFLPHPHAPVNSTILALGNPTITEALSPLQKSEEEVGQIALLFNTQARVREKATESAVRDLAGGVNILHLSAHGQYNPINPLFSTLYLAKDDREDGQLEVQEIYSLDLSKATNLVVLSACQTNLGELSRGDEVVGLTRAFLYAGAPSIISSLWNVDDAATGTLMEQFYTHFKAGMSAAEAMQKAQQAVRTEYPHPYFWAAFSVTGN